jgi:hypothetical protein
MSECSFSSYTADQAFRIFLVSETSKPRVLRTLGGCQIHFFFNEEGATAPGEGLSCWPRREGLLVKKFNKLSEIISGTDSGVEQKLDCHSVLDGYGQAM